MRKAGSVIIAAGIIIASFMTIQFLSTRKVAEIGPIEIVTNGNHTFPWAVFLAFALVITGAIVSLGTRKQTV
jgi:hypothetical protein